MAMKQSFSFLMVFVVLAVVMMLSVNMITCSSVGHMPSMKEDAQDYEEMKGKAEETKDKTTATARDVEKASSSWTQWAKDKISSGLGWKHEEPKLEKTTIGASNIATDAAKRATEQMQDVAAGAGQHTAEKVKEMKDAAVEKLREMKDAAAGKASKIADEAKEQAGYTKNIATEKACQTAECMKKKVGEAASKAKEKVWDAASTAKEWVSTLKDETVNEAQEKTAQRSQDAMEGAKEIGHKGLEKGKQKESETEDHLSWAHEKVKDKAGETLESAKDKINSNYEFAKQKVKEKVSGRNRDEEL